MKSTYFRSMKRFVELIMVVVFFLVSPHLLFAQPAKPNIKQTVKPKPLAKPTKDSLPKQPVNATVIPQKDSVIAFQADSWQLYTNTSGDAKQDVWLINKPVKRSSTDYIFYLLALLFLILGSIRFLFPKYFNDLFGLFFRVTFKQKAIRERLLESTLPSMQWLVFYIRRFFSVRHFWLLPLANQRQLLVRPWFLDISVNYSVRT
jgi:hypothetical protein